MFADQSKKLWMFFRIEKYEPTIGNDLGILLASDGNKPLKMEVKLLMR